jgi:hypothetical protein
VTRGIEVSFKVTLRVSVRVTLTATREGTGTTERMDVCTTLRPVAFG